MSKTFDFKKRKSDFSDAPTDVDVVQSILDVRKVYSSMLDAEFVRMYQRKYKVAASLVYKVIYAKDEILKSRIGYPNLSQEEFVTLFCKDNKSIKPALVRMVLGMKEKG